MNFEEADLLLRQMYPEGEERWVKVKYLDYEKASQHVRFDSELATQMGIEFTALGTGPEYIPNVEALVELKADIEKENLLYITPTLTVELIHALIDKRIHQVIERTVNQRIHRQ